MSEFLQVGGRSLVEDPSIFNMILTASWMAKGILIILLSFSLISWAIILRKWAIFRRLKGRRAKFFHAFERRSSLAEAYQSALAITDNPLTEVFKAGTRELRLMTRQTDTVAAGNLVGGGGGDFTILEKESIHMALERAAAQEVEGLESGLPFLATTGSVAPFFGLFGTVWGIMDAFLSIGLRGSGNISVVAPGVAEALITTLAGLAVAIPAVIAYNAYVSRIKEIDDELRHFSSELINVIIRERRG